MNIPATLRAGDTWSWTDSLSDYPATTWTLRYALRGYGLPVIDLTGSASGADHVFLATAVTTAAYAKGEYDWIAYAERTVGGVVERQTVAIGRVTVLPDIAAAVQGTDNRSHAKKMLDGIEAVLQGRASKADFALTVNGRSIQYLKPKELEEWRKIYKAEVDRETAEANGTDSARIVRVEFGST